MDKLSKIHIMCDFAYISTQAYRGNWYRRFEHIETLQLGATTLNVAA